MLAVLCYSVAALVCFSIGLLYLLSPSFVRIIARNPAAINTPFGWLIRVVIGCILLAGAVLFGILTWRQITVLLV
jgi:hypothetical protein